MQARPVPSFGVGLAAGLVALMAITILLATICLVPLGGVLLLGTLAVGMVGWAATGQWIGQRIGEAVKLEMPDLQATVVGTALMGGVTGFLWAMANCLGIMALMGLGATGLGATILGIQAWRTSRPQRLGSGESPGTPAPTLPPPAAPTGEGGESGPGGEPPAGP